METKMVLTGVGRAKGKAAGEAMVNRQRMGWGYNHVTNEGGVVIVPGADLQGQCITGKIVAYPTVLGSTIGSASLYFKVKHSGVGPAGLICQNAHWIDIAGAIASDIPIVDTFDKDPLAEIRSGDWVEIDAPKVGETATVTITRPA